MKNSRFLSILVLGLCLLYSIITTTNAQTLYVFGDSLYDVGNLLFKAKDVPSAFWPYGLSLDRPTGRWSDGRIIPDFIAKFLGIPEIPPALNKTADFSHGANFAINGASVFGTNSNSMNFSTQVEVFKDMKNNWKDDDISKGIYMLYIGADDYLSFAQENKNPSKDEEEAYVDQVIEEIETNIKTIYDAGGRKFAIQNLAPLGCLPIVMQTYKTGNFCVPFLSNIAALHNQKLLTTLLNLESTLKEFKFIYFDYYNSILRRRSRYFSATISCCGIGSHFAFGCGYKIVRSTVCEFQRGFMFWDGRNHAEKSNEAFGHLFWSADPIIVRPNNLRELYVFPSKEALGLEINNVNDDGFVSLRYV